jgi:type 1 fimbria pilin
MRSAHQSARIAVLAIAILAAIAWPAHAADKLPWQHQAEEFLIDGTARHDSASGDTNIAVNFGWGHYVTDRTEVGAVVNAIFASNVDGYGAGPLYRFNFLPIGCDTAPSSYCKGNLFLTGSASALTGDLADQAAMTAATGLGIRWYTGPGSALNLSLNAQRAINPGPEGEGGANPLDTYSMTIGLSFGVPQSPAP